MCANLSPASGQNCCPLYAFGDVGGVPGSKITRLSKNCIPLGVRGNATFHDSSKGVAQDLSGSFSSENSRTQVPMSWIHPLQGSSSHVSINSPNVLTPSPRPLCAFPPEEMTPTLKWLDNTSSSFIGTSIANPSMPLSTGKNLEASSNFSMALSPAESTQSMKDCIFPVDRLLSSDRESSSMSKNDKAQMLALVPVEKKSDQNSHTAEEFPSEVTTPSNETKAETALRARLYRAKITEGIKALESSIMPFSEKGNKDSVLDDVIDYIKFLKLQLKLLSQNRLGGEATPCPFVQLEGYGHYLLHPQMLSEPLEELMGQMMEQNMPAAVELLESKGLTILPSDLAYNLLPTI